MSIFDNVNTWKRVEKGCVILEVSCIKLVQTPVCFQASDVVLTFPSVENKPFMDNVHRFNAGAN